MVIITIIAVMAEQRKTTTIQIGIDTRDKLDGIVKNKRETYDQIIKRLIYVYETKYAERYENEFTKGYNAVKRKSK